MKHRTRECSHRAVRMMRAGRNGLVLRLRPKGEVLVAHGRSRRTRPTTRQWKEGSPLAGGYRFPALRPEESRVLHVKLEVVLQSVVVEGVEKRCEAGRWRDTWRWNENEPPGMRRTGSLLRVLETLKFPRNLS